MVKAIERLANFRGYSMPKLLIIATVMMLFSLQSDIFQDIEMHPAEATGTSVYTTLVQ